MYGLYILVRLCLTVGCALTTMRYLDRTVSLSRVVVIPYLVFEAVIDAALFLH